MVNDRYIWCRNCGAIHHVTPFDRAPMYALNGDEVAETPANDWREFMARHNGHRLESLAATGSDYYPNGSAVDPMSVRYFEVSNGSDTWLLRRSRASMEEPFRYALVDGRVIESGACLAVQEEAIRKEMKLHFSWAPAAPLHDEKIDRFIGLFREVVNELDPDRAGTAEYSCTEENVAYCELDIATIDALMTKCRPYFQPAEIESLRRFVEAHRESDDVMAVVKRRAVEVGKRSEHPAPELYAFHRR
jgi:hypothetical protein